MSAPAGALIFLCFTDNIKSGSAEALPPWEETG
jgi:hypothetical protein